MNKLPSEKRVCDVTLNTVSKLLVSAGTVCEAFHDKTVRGLQTANLQCDEIWSFCYAKRRNVANLKSYVEGAGDVWTFTALDRDSKLIVSWFAGDRTGGVAEAFLKDVADRIDNRAVHVSTDGFAAYKNAVSNTFPVEAS